MSNNVSLSEFLELVGSDFDEDKIRRLINMYPVRDRDCGVFETGPVRLAFPYLVNPDSKFNQPLYGALALLPPSCDFTPMARHVTAMREKLGNGAKSPFRRFEARKGGALPGGIYEGAPYLLTRSKWKPLLVDFNGRKIEDSDAERMFAPGAWVQMRVRAYDYDMPSASGVGMALQAVMHLSEDKDVTGLTAQNAFTYAQDQIASSSVESKKNAYDKEADAHRLEVKDKYDPVLGPPSTSPPYDLPPPDPVTGAVRNAPPPPKAPWTGRPDLDEDLPF